MVCDFVEEYEYLSNTYSIKLLKIDNISFITNQNQNVPQPLLTNYSNQSPSTSNQQIMNNRNLDTSSTLIKEQTSSFSLENRNDGDILFQEIRDEKANSDSFNKVFNNEKISSGTAVFDPVHKYTTNYN